MQKRNRLSACTESPNRAWPGGRRSLFRFLLCAAVVAVVPAFADAADVAAPAVAQPPPQAAGMRAYIDPHTGEFAEPPPGASSGAGGAAFSKSSEQLREVPGTTPAGGVKVDVRGRFLSTFTATVDAAGKPAVGCRSTGVTAGQE